MYLGLVHFDEELKPTTFRLGIDLKTLVAGVDASIPVVRLTQQQRRVRVAVFLVLVISQRDVVELCVLQKHTR